MYLSLAAQWLSNVRRNLWRAAGILTFLAFTVGIVLIAWVWKQHHGRFAQLKAELKRPAPPPAAATLRPGGQEPLSLERRHTEGTPSPEFLKAVLLPGRGMNLFQISAWLPQKGEVQLLASPTLEAATKQFTGTDKDAAGALSLAVGSAYEAPWAGTLYGGSSTSTKTLNISWEQHPLALPATGHSSAFATATGGLLLERAATSSTTNVMPDGGEAQAVFDAGDFDGRWPSNTKITMTVQLNSRAIEMKMIAKNTGDQAEPIGLGWQPLFAILSADRAPVRLRLPSDTKIERNHKNGSPTGKLLSSPEEPFTLRDGAPLGSLTLDDTFVHLRQALLDNGPVVELRDPENNFGLRLTMLSTAIRTVHIYAPADKKIISIAPRFNYDDPFGREWPAGEDTGMVLLAPGKSVEWHIRLEIFSLASAQQPM
jgi:aldose 1-epimerase